MLSPAKKSFLEVIYRCMLAVAHALKKYINDEEQEKPREGELEKRNKP